MQNHRPHRFAAALFVALAWVIALWTAPASRAAQNTPRATMKPFGSDDEFRDFVKKNRPPMPRRSLEQMDSALPPPPPPAPAPAAETAKDSAGESITNTQEAGVDEGGIVKNYRDFLVILRRGRLFTVSTADGRLAPVDSINAFPPDVNARGDWYDEMLISGDRIIVVGYSYGRGGTEVNRFHIGRDGRLSFEDAYHLRSNDYYSSRNYASRLIGTRLIFYTPLYLPYQIGPDDDFTWLPGVRRWRGDNDRKAFKPMIDGRRIYMPPVSGEPGRGGINALHTVMDCDLASAEMSCRATAILGPASRTFYVSPNAVYVWVSGAPRRGQDTPGSMVYRMPLDGSAPSAIGVNGAPTDQFSFREDWNDGRLNVLVRSEGGGDAMWQPEFKSGEVALLQLPLQDFGDGTDVAPWEDYMALPLPDKQAYGFQNRFVGNYVLYGAGAGWGAPSTTQTNLIAVNLRGGAVTELPLRHGVDRIDAMGSDAIVIGANKNDLTFQAVELTTSWRPKLGDAYVMRGASQGETRSQAFYFKPDPTGGDETAGVLGLPIARQGRPGYKQLRENSAAIVFVSRNDRLFKPLGELGANDDGVTDDACQASCADWYGNARPIFLGGRVFALMGYELVEGAIRPGAIREVRRINFAPEPRKRP